MTDVTAYSNSVMRGVRQRRGTIKPTRRDVKAWEQQRNTTKDIVNSRFTMDETYEFSRFLPMITTLVMRAFLLDLGEKFC